MPNKKKYACATCKDSGLVMRARACPCRPLPEDTKRSAHIKALEAYVSKYREALEKIREIAADRDAFFNDFDTIFSIAIEALTDEKEKK
jgi:hypothetical protein